MRPRIEPSLATWVEQQVGGQPVGVEHVQTLWNGYGAILRVQITSAELASVVVKWVDPPLEMQHPRGWTGQTSHERKLRSYEVERAFYSEWADARQDSHRTAECHAAEKHGSGWRFLFEDLDAAGFDGRTTHLSKAQVHHCLSWLASFHASHVGRAPDGLWETGTYWHLATRADEFDALEDPLLREAAPLLDAALEGCRFKTIVHGDAKIANFCFGSNSVAAVDFQYVGGGCGMKDVAYFLSSCLTDTQCEADAPAHLDTYFALLRQHLDASVDADALEEEWRTLYPAAWADFHRFLSGWAPGHWKIHRYTRAMTKQALAAL